MGITGHHSLLGLDRLGILTTDCSLVVGTFGWLPPASVFEVQRVEEGTMAQHFISGGTPGKWPRSKFRGGRKTLRQGADCSSPSSGDQGGK